MHHVKHHKLPRPTTLEAKVLIIEKPGTKQSISSYNSSSITHDE
jgi:hypothetical protein